MDQPYSRIADTLLDYQYWAANDPQKNIYDDTGWTFGELGNVQVARVTDLKVLDAAAPLRLFLSQFNNTHRNGKLVHRIGQ